MTRATRVVRRLRETLRATLLMMLLGLAGAAPGRASTPHADAEQLPDSAQSVTPAPAGDSVVTAPSAVAHETPAPRLRSRNLYDRAMWGAGHFVADAWYVVSAPSRLNPVSAAGTAVVLSTEAVLYTNDEAIYAAARRNLGNQTYHDAMKLADGYVPIGFMPHAFAAEAGVAVVGYATGIDPLKQIPVECIESHLIAGGIRNVLKPIVGRAHPYEKLGSRHFEFNKGSSFPSGHTSVLFEMATIVSEHVDRVPVTVVLFAGAALGAAQRIESGNHWASDVFLPAVTGTLIAHTVVRRNADRRDMNAAAALPERGWTPLLAVNGRGCRLGVTRDF